MFVLTSIRVKNSISPPKRWAKWSKLHQKRRKLVRVWLAWGTIVILPKWFLLSRLETRTKESTLYASVRVEKLIRGMKVKGVQPQGDNIDRPSMKGLSMSISGRTRKMVNYAWIGRSQEKSWWRLEAVLTCKSLVKFGYRGERLIEPSSSWFPLKFPSG